MKMFLSKLFCVFLFGCLIFDTATSLHNENINTSSDSSNDTLIAAHVIFRHGHRSIASSYPNDLYKDEKHWPDGLGQLTKNGKRQAFGLGEFLRRRYNELLGDKYSPNKIYVQSTNFDRTLTTAQLVLAALFIPTEDEIWNDKILWQPIPVKSVCLNEQKQKRYSVHTLPGKLDKVLAARKPCPKYTLLLENFLKQSKDVQQIYTKYADLFPYLSLMSGSNITTIYDIFNLYFTLEVETHHNKTLPSWAAKSMESLEYIAKIASSTHAATPSLARLKFGYLLKEMLEHFSQKINSTLEPNRSVWLYSGHDLTTLNVLNGLRIHDLHLPAYSSCLMFELHKNVNNEYYVQLFYRKSREEHPLPMEIPNCGRKCPLNQFYTLYNDIIPGDFETECH